MAIRPFLAMTAGEFRSMTDLPPKTAWMACHFSPYTTGLSNIPVFLPPGSLLILNDRTPIGGHDPRSVAFQLADCLESFGCSGILLDFQRSGIAETAVLVEHLVHALPCPVAVSDCYASSVSCPVFLPPLPCHIPLEEYLAPWKGREIWLDAAPGGQTITVTEDGAVISQDFVSFSGGHREAHLHCHYTIELSDTAARFSLRRTREDLEALLEEAEALGVTAAVGLYQELK